MNIKDVILSLRSMLRDDEPDNQRFSDGELKEHIISVVNKIISEFGENIKHETLQIENKPFRLKNGSIAKIYSLKLNNAPLEYTSAAMAFKQNYQPALYHLGDGEYMISNFSNSGQLEIVAAFFIDDECEHLPLNEFYRRLIALGAMIELLSIEIRPDNDNRLGSFSAQYKQEKNEIIALRNRANFSRSIPSKPTYIYN